MPERLARRITTIFFVLAPVTGCGEPKGACVSADAQECTPVVNKGACVMGGAFTPAPKDAVGDDPGYAMCQGLGYTECHGGSRTCKRKK